MNLCVFLAIGESWEDFEKKGQAELLLRNNFHYYSRYFDKTWIFSYGRKEGKLLDNVFLVGNKWNISRFLYIFLMPFLNWRKITQVAVIRGYQLTGGIPAVICQLLYRKPAVFNYGYNYENLARIEGKTLHAFIYHVLKQILVRHAQGILVTTDALSKELFQISNKVKIVPNSVDTQLFCPQKTKKTVGAMFVGRFEPQKNLSLLLQSWSKLPHKYKSRELVFIGTGSLKLSLQKEADRLKVHLRIFERISHEELPKYLSQAQMFILPSFLEGHPKALLEAMSCEMPVIGANVVGVNDVIKHNENGLLVEPTVEALSSAVKMMFSSPRLRNRLASSGRKYIVKNYSAEIMWKKEVEFLKSLV